MKIYPFRLIGLIIVVSTSMLFHPVVCANALGNESKGEANEKVNPGKTLSLDDCIKIGLENYQDIRVAEYDKLWAEAKLSEAKTSRYLPRLAMTNLFGPVPNLSPGFGPPTFPDHDTEWSEWNVFYRIKIEAFQPLYTFGKIGNAVKAATNGVKAKELEIDIKKRDLVHKIRNVYYGIVFGYSGLKLLDEMKDKMISAKKRVRRLLKSKSPEVTELDMLKLKVFEADMKRRYVDAYAGIDTGKRALMVLLGSEPSNSGVTVKERYLRPIAVDVKTAQEYYEIAKENRIELKQLKSVMEIKKSQVKIAKSDFYPTFFLGGLFNYGIAPGRESVDNPYLQDSFNFLSAGAAFGLSQNLNFFLTNTKYRQAKAEYKKLLAKNELAVNGVLLEVRKSYEDVVSKKKLVKITKKGFKDGRSWMTSSYLGFDMGTISTSDLIEAFVAYTKTKMEYFQAIFAYNMATSELSRVTGVEISGASY